MKIQTTCVIALLVVGCNDFEVNTNLGPYAKNTAKTWVVKEYSKDDIMRYNADALGLVEADTCQPKPGDTKPTRSALIKTLKVIALDKGANGVVIEQCTTKTQAMCAAYLRCWGMAYHVPTTQARP